MDRTWRCHLFFWNFTIFINRQELPKAACLAWCCLSITGLASLLLLSLRYWIFPAICLPSNIWAVDLSRFPLSLRSASLLFFEIWELFLRSFRIWHLIHLPALCLEVFLSDRSWSDRSARRFKWWWWRAGTHNFKKWRVGAFPDPICLRIFWYLDCLCLTFLLNESFFL